ncbi:TonB-dependent receptor [Lautropia mirabilis]
MHNAKALPFALLLSTPLVAPAHAQEADRATLPAVNVVGAQDDGYTTPDATSGTKTNAPLRDVPQTINVVPARVLEDQHVNSMQDALKNVPGVSFSHGDGQRDQVSIRGFSAIADQYVDGFRDDALYFRDLSNIERVDVIKGPAAVLYGRGSAGGLINRISKKPGKDITAANLSLGSWKDRRLEADLGRATGDQSLSWRLTGAIEKADSYRHQQFLDRKAIAPSAQIRFSPDTQVLLQAEYLNDRRVTDFGIPSYQGRPVNVDPGTYYGAANARDADYTHTTVQAYTGVITHRIDDTLSLRNATRYYHYELDRNNTTTASVNAAARTVSLAHGNIFRREHGWSNQTELTQQAHLGGLKHELLYGLELGQQNKDLLSHAQRNVATVDIFNPVLPTLARQASGNPTNDNLGRFETMGLYVQDMISIDEQWKVLAGLRYDHFKQETGERNTGRKLQRTDNDISPRLGAVYQPDAAQSYYLSWSRSFQPSGEAFALSSGNANLDPEQTTNTEIGAKYDLLDGRLSTTFSLFRLNRTNVRDTDPATNQLATIGTRRTDGFEWSLSGELAPGWRAIMGYAFLDAKVTRSPSRNDGQPVQGKRSTLTPRHAANFWITKDLDGGFGVGAGANLVGSRYANAGNTVRLPGYVTADAAAWWRQGPWGVQLNVYNITDARYIVSSHGANGNMNLPGAPRNVMLKLSYRM